MPLSRDEFLDKAKEYYEIKGDVFQAHCEMIEFMLKNCEITIPEENKFFVRVNCGYIMTQITNVRAEKYMQEINDAGLQVGQDALAFTGLHDFGHVSCEWESIIELGIYGLKERVEKYAKENHPEVRKGFYKAVARVYDAALLFMERAAQKAAENGKTQMADGLKNLCKGAPDNLFEAIQTIFVYYVIQQVVENTILRTFGRIDKLLFPYYINEEKENAKRLVEDFLIEADGLTRNANNIPFAIGGTDVDGNSSFNELSYLLLDTYKKLNTSEVKLHLLVNDNTPDDIINSAFEGVRDGHNSIVFMSDKKIIESLEKIGAEKNDAVNYHVVGCYECGADNEITCSCNARVNIPKAVEYALNSGIDVLTGQQVGLPNNQDFGKFEDFYAEFERQLVNLCIGAMKITDIYEKHYENLHASPIFSGTYRSSVEKGADIYCDYGAKYNNSSVNGVGLGTAVDSLAAIRKLVFEDKVMSLSEFNEILKSDWKDNEALRLTIKNKYPKYGMGDKKTDALAKNITDAMAKAICGKQNAKGGVYRLGFFSIDWRWAFGEKTSASADGRLSGETISQNSGATFGADRNGATAHLLSTTAIDASNTPNGTIIDVDLHSSAVSGEDGLEAMVATLKTYFKLGGFCVHYNVLDSEILKDAKLNPDKYSNLQVRLCGWNVLFKNLSEKEKDEFIKRAQ